MNNFIQFVCVLFFIVYPLCTETIRCYKCDASDECRNIRNDSPLRYVDENTENLEVIDCEHFCWKAVSLGNVYRGCARKRCAVSHSMGTFSSSVCCQTDYCNRGLRQETSHWKMILVIFISCTFRFLILI